MKINFIKEPMLIFHESERRNFHMQAKRSNERQYSHLLGYQSEGQELVRPQARSQELGATQVGRLQIACSKDGC